MKDEISRGIFFNIKYENKIHHQVSSKYPDLNKYKIKPINFRNKILKNIIPVVDNNE